jgi:hypothetical protein
MQADGHIARLDAAHQEARAAVIAAISGQDGSPGGRLLRWIFQSDISPWDVFASRPLAEAFSSFGGIRGAIDLVNRRIEDGEIAFVRTRDWYPMIFPGDPREADFGEAFKRAIAGFGHGSSALALMEPDGLIDGIDGFMAAFEAHEAARQAAFSRPA